MVSNKNNDEYGIVKVIMVGIVAVILLAIAIIIVDICVGKNPEWAIPVRLVGGKDE